jgi:tetratricopeptide (TPR) repeat protein
MKILRNLLGVLAVAGLLAPGLARADDDLAATLAKLDGLQATRDNPESAKQIDALVSAAMKLAPNDYGVLWRAARMHCWVGEGLPVEQSARRTAEAKQCWDLGAKAVAANAEGVEGNYYAANGAGNYSTEIGVLKALSHGMEGTFNGFLDKAIKLDPGFSNAAPLIAKGRYYFSLPWPKRSYSKAEDHFKKALALQPKAIRAKLWLAETLVADGEAKAAKGYLDQVDAQLAAGGEGFDAPEVRRVQSWLDPVKKKVQEELK